MRRKKYKNIPVTVNGITFDSQFEYNRWCELRLLERAGKITNLKRQVVFELIPAKYETVVRYGKKGTRIKDGSRCIEKSATYIADFVYTDVKSGETVVEDTKGVKTAEYVLKRKMMLHFHGIRIKEVTKQ